MALKKRLYVVAFLIRSFSNASLCRSHICDKDF